LKFFLHAEPGAEPDLEDVGPFRWRATPRYGEIEKKVDVNGVPEYATLYYMPVDATSGLVCASLFQTYDELATGLITADASVRGHLLKAFRRDWPVFWRLIKNGANGRYGDGALTVMEDPDDAAGRWFVKSLLRNIDRVDAKNVLQTPAGLATIDLVYGASFELLNERLNKAINTNRVFFDALAESVRQDPAAVAGLTLSDLGSILGLFRD
jgi:hypothetical protein